jgi:hypothetical protein
MTDEQKTEALIQQMLAQDARSLNENSDDERTTEYERMMAAQMAFDEEQMR